MRWEQPVEYAAITDIGFRRSNNQDAYAVVPATDEATFVRRGHLFLVADGMGAHAVGELASKLASDMVPHNYHKADQLPPAEAIGKALADANASIYSRGQQNRDFQGMGTTATALVLMPEGALVAHVGDSRCYRIRRRTIEQLSFDHSLAWELLRRGRLRKEQIREFVPTNVITRSLGPEPAVEIDLEGPWPIAAGDTYVLCSDGLSGQVTDEEIGAVAAHLPPSEACQLLVDLANLRGGPDNITAVIVRIGRAGHEAPVRVVRPAEKGLGVRDMLIAIGLAVLFLSGGLMALAGREVAGLSPVGVAVMGLALFGVLVAVVRRGNRKKEGSPRSEKGPYATALFQLDGRMVGELAAHGDRLRQTAVEEAWNIEWTSYYDHRNQAEQYATAGQWVEALREYSRALNFLMTGLRRQRKSVERARTQRWGASSSGERVPRIVRPKRADGSEGPPETPDAHEEAEAEQA